LIYSLRILAWFCFWLVFCLSKSAEIRSIWKIIHLIPKQSPTLSNTTLILQIRSKIGKKKSMWFVWYAYIGFRNSVYLDKNPLAVTISVCDEFTGILSREYHSNLLCSGDICLMRNPCDLDLCVTWPTTGPTFECQGFETKQKKPFCFIFSLVKFRVFAVQLQSKADWCIVILTYESYNIKMLKTFVMK